MPLCGARLHRGRDRADPGSDCRGSEADPSSPVAGVLPPGRLGQARRRVAGHDGALRAAGDASRRADRPAAATTPAPCAQTGRLRAGERTTAAAAARDHRGGAAAQPRPRPRPDQPQRPTVEAVYRPLPLSRIQADGRCPDALYRGRPPRRLPRHDRHGSSSLEDRAARPRHRMEPGDPGAQSPSRGQSVPPASTALDRHPKPRIPHPVDAAPTTARRLDPTL